MLGAAFREPPTRLDLAVLDDDRASVVPVAGENLTTGDLLAGARAFADVHVAATEAEALGMVRRGEVDAALLIPRGFLSDLSTLGTNASLRLVVDESDAVRAGVARNAVLGGLEAFLKSVVQRKIHDVQNLLNLTVSGGTTRVLFVDVDILGIDRAKQRLNEVRATLDPQSPEAARVGEVVAFLDFARGVLANSELYLTSTALPLRVETSGLSGRETSITEVALPGALVLGVFWTGALAAALLASRERETGVARRLAAVPSPAWLQGVSKGVVALLAAFLPALGLLLVGAALLDARVVAPGLALVVLLVASLAAAALGAFTAALARGTAAAALLAVLGLVPMLLLAGLFYPVAYMPPAAQAVSRALPVTAATDALRGAMLRGNTLAELAGPLALLLGFAALALVGAALLGRRRG